MKHKRWKKILAIAFAAALVFGQVSALQTETYAATKASKSLNQTKVTLRVGQSRQLKVSGVKASKIKWSTSKKSVVTVSSSGKIKAKKVGKATITAKFSGKTLKCRVTVKAKSSTSKPAAKPTNPQPSKNEKVLVAYFSWSGTSERIAKNIIAQTGADEFRIEREVPYSDDYQTTAYGDAQREAETNARPAIKNPPASIEQYDKVILCYPIWWHTAPMTVGTFLESYDFTGKTIYPVSQSASMDLSQFEESVDFVKECAKGASVDNGLFSKNTTTIQNSVDEIMK